ncbi:ATP-binding protein [Aeromonas veronii]|uniref:Uncharacterized protein n=1 Tax=Aeromonas veronii TaxID=654 RepID=A0A2T4MZM6_AERVE|nr:ATP-binding protein [Aeromonas veronii]PTH80004.1 hypothetical protein DAA48_15685 [Aeromonas veronii]
MFRHQVKLPHGYFAKSKNEYSNWRFSWWREAIQNSVDAGATKIELFIKTMDDGKLMLICRDNGSGMSKSTLQDVFLALGETDKGTDKTGGFGYAKVIILFAHDSYTIKTQDNIVTGMGGSYDIDELTEFFNGTEISVVMDVEGSFNESSFRRQLMEFVDSSSFDKNVHLYLDNKELKKPEKSYAYHVDSKIGKISFNDGEPGDSSRLMIRVNGLVMFTHSVYLNEQSSSFYGILDLDKPSVEILTSNRDGLKYEYSQTLNQIVSVLSQERSSLKCKDLIDVTFNRMYDYEYERSLSSSRQLSGGSAYAGSLSEVGIKGMPLHGQNPDFSGNPFQKFKARADALVDQVALRFGKIDQSQYPNNFKVKTHEMNAENPKKKYFEIIRLLELKRVQKLAWTWFFIIEEILKTEWAETHSIKWVKNRATRFDMPINIGFIFSDEANGLKVRDKDGYHILINVASLDDDYDFEDILDIATHEVTHLAVSNHSEGFCSEEMALRKSLRKRIKARQLERLCLEKVREIF